MAEIEIARADGIATNQRPLEALAPEDAAPAVGVSRPARIG